MANEVKNVTNAKPSTAGAVYCAPLGTALPTDATTALASTYKNLGYISEDGITNSNTISTETVRAWGGDIVLAPQTEKTDTFQYTLLESLNVDTLKAVHGEDNVSGTLSTGITVRVNSAEQDARVYVIEMILKGGVLKRIVIPNGKMTELGDTTYTDNGATGYQTTITAMPSSDIEGDTHREYIAEKVAAAA